MNEVKITVEVVAELVKIVCGFLAIVNMYQMIKAAKAEYMVGVVEGGFLSVLMMMLWKL
jgi:hypothetical protein